MSLNTRNNRGNPSTSSLVAKKEILGEEWLNLKLQQLEEYQSYQIGDKADRQEILDRWVESQQNILYFDMACCANRNASYHILGAWRDGYNSPSHPGLSTLVESDESENSTPDSKSEKISATTNGRSGYN
jgi:hypothetical protein